MVHNFTRGSVEARGLDSKRVLHEERNPIFPIYRYIIGPMIQWYHLFEFIAHQCGTKIFPPGWILMEYCFMDFTNVLLFSLELSCVSPWIYLLHLFSGCIIFTPSPMSIFSR